MSELLPCPFCGGVAECVDNGPTREQVQYAKSWGDDCDDGGSFIHCTVCDASSAIHFDRKENLVGSWNRRAVNSHAELLAAAKGMLKSGNGAAAFEALVKAIAKAESKTP